MAAAGSNQGQAKGWSRELAMSEQLGPVDDPDVEQILGWWQPVGASGHAAAGQPPTSPAPPWTGAEPRA